MMRNYAIKTKNVQNLHYLNTIVTIEHIRTKHYCLRFEYSIMFYLSLNLNNLKILRTQKQN